MGRLNAIGEAQPCSPLSVGDIVTVPLKNRWGIDCAATIEAVHAETVDATVWNLDGPGADRLVTGIPHSVCVANGQDDPHPPESAL
jgi:hypothetical protein